ncbi:GntR family transcriptional regulator [Shimwellia blattae]|uniref:Putative transcriptional regulator n=1 Tax=Shimwellia blattae (strain ATCC 29907 / DSM 4481 / JCM 1650 / NBRC 105725 / CDC 9005-74) TaxID=630626 RepID=I2B5L8_SHIBC|nr:GntR family transcriptional regulator [Shimwellia blattae]AFJ45822.1 putative transcriptional regulator [Shimwellia blattae DSM 4481 = NBRC 105725]GAB82952.1 putative GntR family transcriptional regulator [Shimwellia blattae DSM 4481 = NBRC 105725]VDY63302.1 Uncharacterized HTH-type transcriptional regulator ydfH [Shimwellia blattae]VEC21063.1 Uncharacterized HTH-type transcriptional regulator ydfH [Shimwellia blattae]
MSEHSLSHQAYIAIKNRIIRREYQRDSYTSENKLVEELGMSRTPIREALHQLQSEGLLKIIPRKGILIQQLSLKEIRDYYDLRLAIELQTLRQLQGYLTDTHFHPLEQCIQRQQEALDHQDYGHWLEEDKRFHRYLISLTSNEVFLALSDNIRQRVYYQPDPLRRHAYYTASTGEHQAIVAALKNQDIALAEQLMTTHILRGREHAISG